MTHERLAIACPECSRKYAVPAGSIGPEGRTVRCVSCHHSWLALPDDVKPVPTRVSDKGGDGAGAAGHTDHEGDAVAVTVADTTTRAETMGQPTSEANLDTPAIDDATSTGDYTFTEDAILADGYAPSSSRRRLKVVTALGAVVVLAAAGGAGIVLSDQSDARAGAPALTISIPDAPVRQRSADGREVITTTAQVVNEGTAPGHVPDLKATVSTPDGKVVKEWRVPSRQGVIAPKSSKTVQIGTAGAEVPGGPLKLDVDMIERDGK